MLRIGVGLVLSLGVSISWAAPHVAFYYGPNPPWDELKAFDVVVVEPGHGIDPARLSLSGTRLFAYVSVGEVEPQRPYAKDLPEGIVKNTNEPWQSHVVDQTHPAWPGFFVERVVAPLWAAGFRGFFLDTLDSFQLIATTDEERARQAEGLVAVVRALKARFPEAKLIFNRGFEILPELHREAYAVAVESLYRGWDQKNGRYVEVSPTDRAWLLERLGRVRNEFGLPVIAIEYAPPGERALARATARKIEELGFIPWVSNADHNQLGVGTIEVPPRKVLILSDASDPYAKLNVNRTPLQARAMFESLGYAIEHADINQPLPAYPLVCRYAGVVSWFLNERAVMKPGVRDWLLRQRDERVRIAVLGSFPFPLTDSMAVAFGLSAGPPRAPRGVSVEKRDPVIGLEAPPSFETGLFLPLRANQASATLLRLRSDGDVMDAAALMPWGGYVLVPYGPAPDTGADRWLIEPVEFMRRALVLPPASTSRRIGGEPSTGAIPGGALRCGLQPDASERASTHCAT
ncbi:MAG: endo alpha-1,4 polygalactosaminidase [Burkholderiales bacterium]